MSTSHDQILELLDGELDPMVEPTLFAELASSSDLRNEFKQQLAIRSAVERDRMALLPPAALTSAVFTGLGFAAPIAGAAAGAVGGSAVVSWITKLGLPMLTAAAAAGMTWIATQQTEDARLPARDQAGVSAYAEPTTEPRPATKASTPASSNAALSEAQQRASAAQRALALEQRENDRLRTALAMAEERIPAQNIEIPAVVTPAPADEFMPLASSFNVTSDIRLARTESDRPVNTATFTESAMPWQRYPSFLVQVRGLQSTPLTPVSVPAQSGWLDNAGLSLQYQLSDHHGIGLEFGSESFAQVFEGQRNGQLIRYEQQPSSSWAGIFYRYQHTPIAQGFLPFAQLLVGGSRFGPIGRATVGMAYAPAGPLTFLVGVEGATMAYEFQNTWFTSTNLGFTYGVAVRF